MKLNLISILTSTFLASAAIGASTPPLTVAVYDFKGDGNAAGYGGKITTLVTADLTTETNLVMVERAELTKALDEQAFGVSGMVSSDAAAKIGQITGAKVLVAGQLLKIGDNHLVIVASIIGTETGRLFAAKVEGVPDNLLQMTTDLSRNIAKTISDQATNLVAPTEESHAERLARIVKSIKGKNRPTVSIEIYQHNGKGNHWRDFLAESEYGTILMKAGFTVVDDNSDRKPEVQISGNLTSDTGPQRGALYSASATVELKVQERKSGTIIAYDRQESPATGLSAEEAEIAAQVNAVDDLAERILPALAQ